MIPFPYTRSLLTRRRIAASNDPNFSNVSLLLHMNGTNGSTTFLDNSSNAFSPTVNGNAQISTAQSKFGGASGLFDGSGDNLSYANNTAFDISSVNFTVECFVYPQGSTDRGIFSKRNASSNGYALEVRSTGAVWLRASIAGSYSDTKITTSTGLVSNSTWTHIALVRNGNLFTIYVGGVSSGTFTSSGALENLALPFIIGKSAGSVDENPYNGYIDEFRITKGVARYTANFTPPTAQFPDS